MQRHYFCCLPNSLPVDEYYDDGGAWQRRQEGEDEDDGSCPVCEGTGIGPSQAGPVDGLCRACRGTGQRRAPYPPDRREP